MDDDRRGTEELRDLLLRQELASKTDDELEEEMREILGPSAAHLAGAELEGAVEDSLIADYEAAGIANLTTAEARDLMEWRRNRAARTRAADH
jgi:hypothetical protein